MGKKWLILGTVSFGVSLGLGLVINRNLKQAVLTGILSVPASFVGVSVAEHLLKQKFNEKGLTRQEAELSNSISLFSDRVKDLKQQEKDIKGIILTLNEDKQRSQSKLDNLQNQIAQLEDRKSNLKLNIATLKDNLKQFREQEIILAKTVEELFNSQKQIVITLESDRNTLNRLQQQKSDLESTIIGLSADEEQQHKLLAEVNNLQTEIDVIRQEAKEEKQTLAELKIEQEQTTANLIQLREKGNLVQAQIDNCETLKLKLEQDSTQLELEKKRLQTFNSGLNLEIEQLTNQKIELNQFLKNLAREQQELEANCQESRVQLEQLSNSISEQQQLKNQLETEFANLLRQKQDLLLPIQQPQPLAEIQVKPDEVEQEPEEENNTEVPEIKPISDQTDSTEEKSKLSVYIDSHDDYDFSDAKRTKYLWENTIFPYWSHKDRPVGYRFLGNIDIESSESDRLIDIVGQNLQRLNSITDNSLQQSFSALEKDWVKIITFALSEYAYYYSEERFWEGFCDRINIKHNQTVENTLRQVTEQGIDLLGLIKASGGYKYVSTLWLQSGVPKQNLGHFATIVQDLADEYGWWEISHSSAKDIAETLWQYWQDKYSQWGTIRNFLNLDNSNEEVEPISGVLVKNIAIFAKELERQNISPVSLQNEKVREELLINSNLSYSFFLRDWSDLIALLTPREGASDRSIRRRHNQPPYLYLDVADTLNTLLILPEQSLWKKEWRNLRGTYCLIPEAGWEDNIPTQGNLEIPELEIDIKKTAHEWSFQLQNHYRNQIYQWKHKGVDAAFPCLVFDAISGDYIRINIDKPEIKGIGEIILYTPREVKIEVDNNIEIVDSYVPSSLKGWSGTEIRLVESEALIQIQDIIISWQLQEQEQPQLIGLRLKGKKVVYINAPTFYYPPQLQELTINYSIEDLDQKEIIAKEYLALSNCDSWTGIDLSQWISKSGNYQAEFWHQQKQYSYRFAVRKEYHISQHKKCRAIEIYDCYYNRLSTLTKYENIDKFWAEEIKINNLYPLEKIIFSLKSDFHQYNLQVQADSSGKLTLSLASLYDCLPKCNRYSLDIKQSGYEFQSILQVGCFLTSKLTATEVTLEGLLLEDNYCLAGWNLLIPDKKTEIINFFPSSTEQTRVNLNFSPGIYQIKLYQGQQLIEDIGFWCGIEPQNIPNEIHDDDSLANYCYTILGNESIEDFSIALEQLKYNFDREMIQVILEHFYQEKIHIPQWLNKNDLVNKIQKILEIILSFPSTNNPKSKINIENMEPSNQVAAISGQWCLVTVRPWKRETFLKYLDSDIQRDNLQEIFLEIIAPEESIYQDMVLIRNSSFIEARKHLQQIDHFQGIQRLKPSEVSRMLNK